MFTCSLFERCTKNKSGRLIERSEQMDLIDVNKKRIQQNLAIYRKRQAIVEHPFGVIKRQWDFYYIITKKSMKHASADVGLIFTCHNLRRIMNLVEKNQLKKFLKGLDLRLLILTRCFNAIRRLNHSNYSFHVIKLIQIKVV